MVWSFNCPSWAFSIKLAWSDTLGVLCTQWRLLTYLRISKHNYHINLRQTTFHQVHYSILCKPPLRISCTVISSSLLNPAVPYFSQLWAWGETSRSAPLVGDTFDFQNLQQLIQICDYFVLFWWRKMLATCTFIYSTVTHRTKTNIWSSSKRISRATKRKSSTRKDISGSSRLP